MLQRRETHITCRFWPIAHQSRPLVCVFLAVAPIYGNETCTTPALGNAVNKNL